MMKLVCDIKKANVDLFWEICIASVPLYALLSLLRLLTAQVI